MASFGGSVKLTGESEYRAALRQITQNLKEVASQMKLVDSQYGASDASTAALTAKSEVLNNKLEQQRAKLATLQSQYAKMSDAYQTNTDKHEKLVASYEQEKSELERIGQELGTTSPEYKEQAQVVAQLARDVDKSTKAQDSNALSMSKVRTQMNGAQADINKTKSEINELDSQMGKSATSSDKLGKSVEDAGEKARRAEGGFTVLKGAIANIAGNIVSTAISGIQNLAGSAIESSDALKKFESTMSFAGYDDSTIAKAKDDMKLYADQTVYDLDTVANTTAQLAANGIEDYTGLTQAAGNLNAVAGGNADTFKSVAMVLTQTAGAGKLTTENWNQLANAIPGASGKLQEALLKNEAYTGNFRDALEKGEISADEFNQAIMDLGFTDAAQQAATSTETFEGAMGNLEASVTDGLMQIYDAIGSENVTGFINSINDGITEIVPYIKDAVGWLVENLPKIAPMLAAIAGGLAGLLVGEKIQKVVTAFKDWKKADEELTVAQRLLNFALKDNPIGTVITLVGLLAGALIYAYTTNEDFRNKVNEAWNTIKETVGTIVDALKKFFTEDIPNAIQTMIQFFQDLPGKIGEALQNAITNVANWASNMAQQAADAGSQFVSNVINFVQNLPYNLGYLLGEAIGNVINFVGDMASNAQEAGSQFIDNVVSFIQDLPGNIASFLSDAISNVSSWVGDMASNAADAGSQFLDNVGSFLADLPGNVAGFLGDVISNAASWASDMASAGAEGASNLFNAVVDGLSSLPSQMISIGSDIVNGIWDGISNAGSWFADKVRNFGKGIVDGMKASLDINSPSRVMRDEVGKYIAQGIGVGFVDEMGNVTRQMTGAMPDPSVFVESESAAYGGSSAAGAVSGSSVADAVVEALGRVRIVLDDEVAGKFVERTVARAIYA